MRAATLLLVIAPALCPQRKPEPVLREVVTDADGRVVSDTKPLDPSAPARAEAELPDIEKARDAVGEFTARLPNFTCVQHVTRFEAENRRAPQWKRKDRFTLDVLYLNGEEHYSNLRRNGKLVKRGSPTDSGMWSRGEFGTMQQDLFAGHTDAEFKSLGETDLDGRRALKYRFRTPQERSRWRVTAEGATIRPAFKGHVWIDRDSLRVLRIEKEAIDILSSFRFDIVETTIDFGPVEIAGETVLMPVRAASLACQRDSVHCTRNDIEFRDYKKFAAESTVSTTESSISFPGDPAPK